MVNSVGPDQREQSDLDLHHLLRDPFHIHIYIMLFRIFISHIRKKMFTCCHSKCPKILNTKVSDKMIHANSADPDQTASEGAV